MDTEQALSQLDALDLVIANLEKELHTKHEQRRELVNFLGLNKAVRRKQLSDSQLSDLQRRIKEL